MLLIFVIETTESNDSDKMYISKYLNTRFPQLASKSDIVVNWVYLNGKANYKKANIEKKIKYYESRYLTYHPGSKDLHVLYCIDIDAVDTNKDNVKQNKEINEYCSNNGFHLIWFNKTIEHAFLGRLVHQAKNKKAEAMKFYKRQLSSDECCNSKYLLKCVNETQLQTSNIGFVLGEIIGS